MMLEMDNNVLLPFLESEEPLKNNVEEAVNQFQMIVVGEDKEICSCVVLFVAARGTFIARLHGCLHRLTLHVLLHARHCRCIR